MKQCRCCKRKLAGKTKFHSAFDKFENGQTYAAFLKQWAHIWIKPNDGLPQVICESCYGEIKDMFDFGSLVRSNIEYLGKEADEDDENKQCRCCLATDSEEYHWIHDGLPQVICESCYGEIKDMFDFGSLVRSNIEYLGKEADEDDENKQCRCCLATDSEEYHWIHDEWKSGPTYADLIQDMAKIKINDSDGLTQHICIDCLNQVESWLSFGYYTVYETNEQFKKLNASIVVALIKINTH